MNSAGPFISLSIFAAGFEYRLPRANMLFSKGGMIMARGKNERAAKAKIPAAQKGNRKKPTTADIDVNMK